MTVDEIGMKGSSAQSVIRRSRITFASPGHGHAYKCKKLNATYWNLLPRIFRGTETKWKQRMRCETAPVCDKDYNCMTLILSDREEFAATSNF
ncbi:MAG TPA: hypothetical protein VIJ17_04330, partial [Pseudolabrys sp.]